MSTLLLAIHGMGDNPAADWHREIRDKLTETADRYRPAFDSAELWSAAKLVPISYDSVFETTIDAWKASAATVSGFAGDQELAFAGPLDWLDSLEREDPSFFWSHLADVVIYRFFRQQRERIRALVANQIVQAVQDDGTTFDRCVLLAHSLGTSVLHDTIHLLTTDRIAGLHNTFSPPSERFRAIFTVANVSRLLQGSVRAYDSVVRPGARNRTGTCCSRFYSFYQETDPFCIPWRFNPVGVFPAQLHRHEKLEHYRDWNVHGYCHYLDHPRVHARLFNALAGRKVISSARLRQAVSEPEYPQFGGRFAAVQELRDLVAELRAETASLFESSSLEVLFSVAVKVQAIVGKIRTRIGP